MSHLFTHDLTEPFPVRDEAAFLAEMDDLDVRVHTYNDAGNKTFAVADECGEGWPSFRYSVDADGSELEEEIDGFVEEILVKHIAPGALGIVRGASFEEGCYVGGYAAAFNSEGVVATVNLHGIEDIARAKLAASA